MTVSIKEYVTPGYKRYVHPDALPSPVNPMTATITTPLVIMGVVVICVQPSAMNGANTSPANQPNSNPSRGEYTTRRTAEGSAISIAAIVGLTAIVGPASMWCQPWW
jgi:hypothetical protein